MSIKLPSSYTGRAEIYNMLMSGGHSLLMETVSEEFNDFAGGGRKLTEKEVELARSIFSDKIDYDKVRIHNHNNFLLGNKAIAPNGEIYFPKNLHMDDLTATSYARGIFIHEMTHVWQYQNGRSVIGEAVGETLKRAFNLESYGVAYDYDLHEVEDFHDLNLEQQAEFIKDYFWLKERGIESDVREEILIKAGFDICDPVPDEAVIANNSSVTPNHPKR